MLSWLLVCALVVVAINPAFTLWGLTELKMEILAQVAPLFVLGVAWPRLTTGAALGGLLGGTVVYGTLLIIGHPEPWSVHAGVVALGVNVAVCTAGTLLAKRA